MANFDFKETFLNPIFKGNPISVLVLGISLHSQLQYS